MVEQSDRDREEINTATWEDFWVRAVAVKEKRAKTIKHIGSSRLKTLKGSAKA